MRLLVFIILLLCSSTYTFSASETFKNKCDSIRGVINSTSRLRKVTAINELAMLYLNQNIDTSMFYLSMGLMEAKKCGESDALFKAYYGLASVYVRIGSNKEAIDCFTKAINLSEYCTDKVDVVYCNKYIAFAYRNLNQFPIAIDHLNEAALIANKIKRYDVEGDIYLSLSRFYRDMSNYPKALECGLKALEIFTQNGYTSLYPSAYRSIAAVHRELNDLTLAEEYYTKAQQILEKEGNPLSLVDLYIEMAIFYDRVGDFDKCINYNYKSLELARTINDVRRIAAIRNNLGFALFNAKKYKESIRIYEEIWHEYDNFNREEDKISVALILANAWIKLKNIEKSDYYMSKVKPYLPDLVSLQLKREYYHVLGEIAFCKNNITDLHRYKTIENMYVDSLSTKDHNQVVLEMQSRFDFSQQKYEIEMLKAENKAQRMRKNFWMVFGVLFVLIASIVSFFTIQNMRKNTKMSKYNNELELANRKLKESEEKLKGLNATKDKIFSIIGHDLKNPFNAMLGFCEMLSISYNQCSEEQYRSYINVVSDSGRSIYNLLDNLLQWSKTQVGKISYKPVLLNLEQAVNEEVHLLTPNATNKGIDILVDIESNEVVYADQYSISIVIRNLISNALKFTFNGGKIRIKICHRADTQMVEVVVIDNGVGMTKEEQGKLFSSNGSFTTKGTANEPGTGLGLMLCKEFVENNGGKIWVVSTKGEGSEFHFTLPDSAAIQDIGSIL